MLASAAISASLMGCSFCTDADSETPDENRHAMTVLDLSCVKAQTSERPVRRLGKDCGVLPAILLAFY
jgi:hypothetical protein